MAEKQNLKEKNDVKMKVQILRCPECCTYTLKTVCPKCDSPTVTPKPAKFSPEDKWGRYRRMAKEEIKKK